MCKRFFHRTPWFFPFQKIRVSKAYQPPPTLLVIFPRPWEKCFKTVQNCYKIDRILSNSPSGGFSSLPITNLDVRNISNVRVRVYTSIFAKILILSFDLEIPYIGGYASPWNLVLTEKNYLKLELLNLKLYILGASQYQKVGSDHKFVQTNHWMSTYRFILRYQFYSLIQWLHILGSFDIKNSVMSLKTSQNRPFRVYQSVRHNWRVDFEWPILRSFYAHY